MTTRILHRKTSVKDRAPIASDTANNGLLPGEIGINYNVDSPKLYIRDSADNIIPFEPGGNASVTIGVNPPGTPVEGDLWWNPEDGVLYIYYTDVDSSQWVPASPQGGGDITDDSGVQVLNDLLDVVVPGALNFEVGQFLQYGADGKWTNGHTLNGGTY